MPDEERMAVAEKVKADPDSAKSVLAGNRNLDHRSRRQARTDSLCLRLCPRRGSELVVLSDEPMGFLGGSNKSKKGLT
jgi:hypothetical protein